MPKVVSQTDRRRVIADAAIGVIGTNGIEGLTLRDVAKAADVTTGAVTHYFDSKTEVLEAAQDEVVRRLLDMQNTPLPDGTSVTETAAAFLPNGEEQRRDWKVWFAFWAHAMNDARLRDKNRVYYEQFTANTERWVRTLQETGLADRDADPRTLADALIAVSDGLGIRIALEPDDWPRERQMKVLGAAIEPILRART